MVQTMKRHEWWRHNYHQRRYLEHASAEELQQRAQDLLENVCDFTAEGQLGLKHKEQEIVWLELFTHFLEELGLRGQPMTPEMLRRGQFTLNKLHISKRAAEIWHGHDIPLGTYLVKFGKLKYLQPLLNAGSMRIAPASFYRDPSLNFSIRDSELEFTQEYYGASVRQPPNGDYTIPQDQWAEMPIFGTVKSTLRAHSDYYIACFSGSYEYRLFDDFEADGCLVIKDIMRFVDSVGHRMHERLPGWEFMLGDVDYRDPYYPKQDINIFFCKHIRHAYQKEFRFVWKPPATYQALKPIHLELGLLKEYCELVTL
jgi:hypothetical protein